MKDNNSLEEEEIDLLSILKSIKKGFATIFRLIGGLIHFSIKNKNLLIVFIILGIGISIGIFFLKKTVYIADLTISHTRLNNGECYSMIDDLTKIRDNYNDTILSEKLGIDVRMAKQIKSISCKALNEALEKNYKDSAFVLLPFKIEVKVYNTSILDSVQKGILRFLESNEYASKRKRINRDYIDKYEERIKTEIIAIDSLKHIVDKSIIPRSTGNGIILGEPIDPVKVYQASMNLYQSQLQMQEQRELNNSFEVMVGFSKDAIKDSKLILNIIIGFILGYLIGVLWIIRKQFILRKGQ